MNIKPQEVVIHELIGREVEIMDSKNKSLIGLRGKIIDETKKTLLIESNDKKRLILKEQVILSIEGVKVDGKTIANRPEDRIRR